MVETTIDAPSKFWCWQRKVGICVALPTVVALSALAYWWEYLR